MTDPYNRIRDVKVEALKTIADRLEERAAQEDQRAMLQAYLDDITFAPQSKVIEVGCGTGAVARVLASHDSVQSVIGVDPSEFFVERARLITAEYKNILFEVADATMLPFKDRSFDVVIFHTALCHIDSPERAIEEAWRVLKPAGWLAAFDGDYATSTVAIAEHDPLQACSSAVTANNVRDRFIVRRLPAMVKAVGFEPVRFRSHGYAEVFDPQYMLGHAVRGADLLVASGVIGHELGEALKVEAHQRVARAAFFGHIAYASLVAFKPA